MVDGVMMQRHIICSKKGLYSPIGCHDESIPWKKWRIQNTRTSCEAMHYIGRDEGIDGMLPPLCHVITMKWFHLTKEGTFKLFVLLHLFLRLFSNH